MLTLRSRWLQLLWILQQKNKTCGRVNLSPKKAAKYSWKLFWQMRYMWEYVGAQYKLSHFLSPLFLFPYTSNVNVCDDEQPKCVDVKKKVKLFFGSQFKHFHPQPLPCHFHLLLFQFQISCLYYLRLKSVFVVFQFLFVCLFVVYPL